MADAISIRHSGIDKVKAALNGFAGDLRKTVRGSLRTASRPIQRQASADAPSLRFPTRRRVPGTIKRNVRIFNSKRANGKGGVIGVYVTVKASRKDLKRAPVSGDPYYWRWVESGHKIVARFKGKYTDYRQRGRGRLTGLAQRRKEATGFVEGRAFLLGAYRAHGQKTIGLFTDEVLKRVAKVNSGRK